MRINNSLGINYSAVPANLMHGLASYVKNLNDRKTSSCVALARQNDPVRTLAALSRFDLKIAGPIMRALPGEYAGRMFSCEDVWPDQAAAPVIERNFTSAEIAGIFSKNMSSWDRTASLLRRFRRETQFIVLHQMLPDAAASAVSTGSFTPHELLLAYSSNMPQITRFFPFIAEDKAKEIMDRMSNDELKSFLSTGQVSLRFAINILSRREPVDMICDILDAMPDHYLLSLLGDDTFPVRTAARYAETKFVSRPGNWFSRLPEARQKQILGYSE